MIEKAEECAAAASPATTSDRRGESCARSSTRRTRVGAYRAVERAMRRLRRACRPGSSVDERLRRPCLRHVA